MRDETKLSVAMELIEQQIAECLNIMNTEENDNIKQKYNELLNNRKEIYNNNYEVIENIIEEARRKEND